MVSRRALGAILGLSLLACYPVAAEDDGDWLMLSYIGPQDNRIREKTVFITTKPLWKQRHSDEPEMLIVSHQNYEKLAALSKSSACPAQLSGVLDLKKSTRGRLVLLCSMTADQACRYLEQALNWPVAGERIYPFVTLGRRIGCTGTPF